MSTAQSYKDYIEHYSGNEDSALNIGPVWHSLIMGRVNPKKMEDGTLTQRDKFCCEGFPEQNLSEFTFIPLYINTSYRACYLQGYGGEAGPPDCSSTNGYTPVKPFIYGEKVINRCSECDLHGYGSEFPCHTKPVIVGLAWFPEHGDLLVPVRKELPGKSAAAASKLGLHLQSVMEIEGEKLKPPHWMRLVTVFIDYKDSKKGVIPGWGFQLQPKLIPKQLIEDVAKLLNIAKSLYGETPMPPLLGSSAAPDLSKKEVAEADEIVEGVPITVTPDGEVLTMEQLMSDEEKETLY